MCGNNRAIWQRRGRRGVENNREGKHLKINGTLGVTPHSPHKASTAYSVKAQASAHVGGEQSEAWSGACPSQDTASAPGVPARPPPASSPAGSPGSEGLGGLRGARPLLPASLGSPGIRTPSPHGGHRVSNNRREGPLLVLALSANTRPRPMTASGSGLVLSGGPWGGRGGRSRLSLCVRALLPAPPRPAMSRAAPSFASEVPIYGLRVLAAMRPRTFPHFHPKAQRRDLTLNVRLFTAQPPRAHTPARFPA